MIDRTARTYRIAAAVGLLLLIQSPGAFLGAEDDKGASTRVARMVSMLQARQGDSFWSLVSRIEEIGKPAIPALKARLAAESGKTRLGCAKALLGLGDSAARKEALVVLGDRAEKSIEKTVAAPSGSPPSAYTARSRTRTRSSAASKASSPPRPIRRS